ncbi:hypothetical protein [Alteromonas lipolytica]|uniref:Uncharacterized protein n=1 Tax=Alteromonas lipolytica TaxID=1856405 RepID=A0A1E8FE54_9ALTE|nr:hypothetical protein [Alteromonas lipolytica]OFI34201.1 hypothetical protein BFC17_21935 [Alteromonas lipolytica]GGF84183.1 hypothetical protein GCM10011338_40590 [Alteromonas lipolytica]
MKIQIVLTDGAIRNSYINLRGHLDKFADRFIGAADMTRKGQYLKLDVGSGVSFETDVCGKHQRFRNRSVLKVLNDRFNFVAGDVLVIEQLTEGNWKVSIA